MTGEIANLPMEALVRQPQPERNAGLLDHLVPAIDARLDFTDVIVAKPLVERIERRDFIFEDASIPDGSNLVRCVGKDVVVVDFRLLVASLEAGRVEARGV